MIPTHEVWKDGELVTTGSKKDCTHLAAWLRERLRLADERVAGRVGVHPINKKEDNDD